jgi:hypothetical protein
LITVTEEAKMLLSTFDPSTLDSTAGAVLRLDPVANDEVTGVATLDFAPGEGKDDDQIVQQDGKQVLRIAGAVSQRLNGSIMDVVVEERPEGTRMGIGIVPPDSELPTDDS